MASSRTWILAAVAMSLAPASAVANVSERNGNFFIGYTDVSDYPGIGLTLARTYNSKSSFSGMFGFGWGSDYEIYLEPQGDGTVVVHENGGGSNVVFTTPDADDKTLHTAVLAIAAARTKLHDLTADQMTHYQDRLATDERFRHDEWSRLQLPARKVPVGTRLTTLTYAYQVLTRTETGYKREGHGQIWEFADDGKLRRVSDQNEHWLTVDRDAAGHLKLLRDDAGHTIQLDVDDAGHLLRAITSEGKVARFRYTGDQLVYAIDTDANQYVYKYDDRYNLTRIGYVDGTELVVAYDPVEANEGVRLVHDRDGSVTTYVRLGGNDPAAMEYGLTVERRGPDGAALSHRGQAFYQRVNAAGTGRYVYREVSDDDGDHRATIYDESARPLEIVRNGTTATFRYDDQGRPTYRADEDGVRELEYGDVGKVSKVRIQTYQSGVLVEKLNATYRYDAHANLVDAKLSDGLNIALTYDWQGRIATLKTSGGPTATAPHELTFRYTAKEAKPARISLRGVGDLTITYTPDGEVDKIETTGGHDVSISISTMFLSLLDAIRPAGVEF